MSVYWRASQKSLSLRPKGLAHEQPSVSEQTELTSSGLLKLLGLLVLPKITRETEQPERTRARAARGGGGLWFDAQSALVHEMFPEWGNSEKLLESKSYRNINI